MIDLMVMVVLKSIAGWLFNAGRRRLAERLRHGDVFDRQLCRLIESDLDNIKGELKAQRRQNLAASINLFKEGISSLSADGSICDDEIDGPPARKRRIDIPSSTTRKRFKEARREANLALGNSALSTEDSILATYIKIMATFLEEENPTRAIRFCKEYLENLHSLNNIIEGFKTEFRDSPRKYFGNSMERKHIIWLVCHVNRVVFDMAQEVSGDKVFQELFVWPCIEIKSQVERKQIKIDPLRDPKLREPNFLNGKESHSVVRSFDQEGAKEQHKVDFPSSIAATADGQFLVVDNMFKMFDNSGKYLTTLRVVTDRNVQYHAVDVDIDKEDSIHLLVQMVNEQNKESWYEVFVFERNGSLFQRFALRSKCKGCKLAVNQHCIKTEVLVLTKEIGGQHAKKEIEDLHSNVEVYETGEGTFVSHFGGNILMDAQDLVCDGAGHTFVLDKCHCGSEKKYIRVFGARRYQLRRFEVDADSSAVAFHRASGHIVIASIKAETDLFLFLYTSDGTMEHTHKIVNERRISNPSITVTTKGRIVVAEPQFEDKHQGKVIVY